MMVLIHRILEKNQQQLIHYQFQTDNLSKIDTIYAFQLLQLKMNMADANIFTAK